MRAVYHEHHPYLWKFVRRRIPVHRQDAEDVCQETWSIFFLRFDDHMRNYATPRLILCPIARYRVADYWRRHGRNHEAPVEGEDLALLADAVAGTRYAFDDEGVCRNIDLMEALAGLPRRQREALHFHYLDELTVEETAQLMAISANTVKKNLTRAREQLKKSLHLHSYELAAKPEEVHE
ncbi:RNA polymerase sigma factor [Streptomyces sp. NPDC051572]|uniref:RNA polymerase sigma factor n=1 Tax=Streptomyces sp. NPDC051572 TaxID=3155802 RepID=UPI0034505608